MPQFGEIHPQQYSVENNILGEFSIAEENRQPKINTEDSFKILNLEHVLDNFETLNPHIVRRSSRDRIPKKPYPIKDNTNVSSTFLTRIIVESIPKNTK